MTLTINLKVSVCLLLLFGVVWSQDATQECEDDTREDKVPRFNTSYWRAHLNMTAKPPGMMDAAPVGRASYELGDTGLKFWSHFHMLMELEDVTFFRRLTRPLMINWQHGRTIAGFTIDGKTEALHYWELGRGRKKFFKVIEAGTWMTVFMRNQVPNGYTLMGFTLVPEASKDYQANDIEVMHRDELGKLYPQHADLIRRYGLR